MLVLVHGRWVLGHDKLALGHDRKAMGDVGGVGDALPLVGMNVHDDVLLSLLREQANQDMKEDQKDYPLLLLSGYRDIDNHLGEYQS